MNPTSITTYADMTSGKLLPVKAAFARRLQADKDDEFQFHLLKLCPFHDVKRGCRNFQVPVLGQPIHHLVLPPLHNLQGPLICM
jgi:hypothetical protein